jgi:hypothetical protein
MRVLTYWLAVVFWIGGLGGAFACQCADPPGIKNEEPLRLRLEKATDVVKGRITQVNASESTKRNGFPVVVAQMKVTSVVKGEIPLGDITIVTGFGDGDCGIPGLFLSAIARGNDATLSVSKNPEVAGEYWVGMCGYGKVASVLGKDPN